MATNGVVKNLVNLGGKKLSCSWQESFNNRNHTHTHTHVKNIHKKTWGQIICNKGETN